MGGPEEHYVHWLKDEHMLPAVVPDARIMRYGYQSQWFGDEAISQKASTVAQRLLLSLKRTRKVYGSCSPRACTAHVNEPVGLPAPSSDIHRALLWRFGGPEGRSSGWKEEGRG